MLRIEQRGQNPGESATGDSTEDDREPVEVQAHVRGNTFRREIAQGRLCRSGKSIPVYQDREVSVYRGYDRQTGEFVTVLPSETPVQPSDVPALSYTGERIIYDRANEGSPSFDTVLSHGASRAHRDSDRDVIARGGDPDYKIIKPAHSFLRGEKTFREIYGRPTTPELTAAQEESDIIPDDHTLDDIPW